MLNTEAAPPPLKDDIATAAVTVLTKPTDLNPPALSPPIAASPTSIIRSPSSDSAAFTPLSGSSGSTRPSRSSQRKRNGSNSCDSGTSGHDLPRVVFGPGTIAQLPSELGRLGLNAPLIVSSPSRIALARRIQSFIPNLESRILDSAVVNVPTRVVDDAVARIAGHDVVISVGAGSAIGLAKAISIRKGIPHVCIPTTYSGSEMSPLLAADGRKMGHKGSKLMPTVVIYDENLTGPSTPKRFSASMDASASDESTPEPLGRRSLDDSASWSYIHLPGI